jgi:hypothetical protein
VLLISALDGGEWSASLLGRFSPCEIASVTHSIREQVLPLVINRDSIIPILTNGIRDNTYPLLRTGPKQVGSSGSASCVHLGGTQFSFRP